MSLYLDYNSTTPVDKRVLDVMMDVYLNRTGNADSRTHDFGGETRKIVELGRRQVAELLGVKSNEVFFTSGATESNNIAIQGLREYAEKTGNKHIITSSIEHHAVLNTVKFMEKQGFDVDYVDPGITGEISAEEVISKVREDTLLVSIMHVNNETGMIQPVKEIGAELEKRGVLFHTDATQSCGKLVDEVKSLKYDMLSFSAHKFFGPQGIGGLILRRKQYKLPPVNGIIFGGQQENGIRPGTTPVALVAGCGKAAEIALGEYRSNYEHDVAIKKKLLQMLDGAGIPYRVNGNQANCISSSINIQLVGIDSEALMIATKQYCGISNGSACTSKSYAPSYVLMAMGLPVEQIENSIRVSWGPGVEIQEFELRFSELLEVARALGQ